jgi:hypothetical protein
MYIYNIHAHLATEDQAYGRQQQADFPSHLCAADAAQAVASAMQLHTHKGTKEHRNAQGRRQKLQNKGIIEKNQKLSGKW